MKPKIRGVLSFIIIFSISINCNKTVELPFNDPDPNDNYFSIAIIPDTQYYIGQLYGGDTTMFIDQINWILTNRTKEHISYVIHLGDVTQNNSKAEWIIAKRIMQPLADQALPFGIAIGNHDESPKDKSALGKENTLFNQYFGQDYFQNKSWYGGSMGNNNNNDNHFDLLKVNNKDFIILYNDFNQPGTKYYDSTYENKVLNWNDSILSAYPNNKAIIVSHSLLSTPNQISTITINKKKYDYTSSFFSPQGSKIYDCVKKHENVFLMLCGHITGESFRMDKFKNSVIKTFLTDYQFQSKGGNGVMRLMRINLTKQTLSGITFKPNSTGGSQRIYNNSSQFELPLFN